MSHNNETTHGQATGSLIRFVQYSDPTTQEEHLNVFLHYMKTGSVFIGGAVQKHDPEGMSWINSTESLSALYTFHPQNFGDVKTQILPREHEIIEREIADRRLMGKGTVPRLLTARLKELDAQQRADPEKEIALRRMRNSKSKEQSRIR